MTRPNVLFVFADQWRAQACGYAGNPNVRTPHLDALADESLHCANAISGCPVCSPYRASFLTGRPPHVHGVFVNDVCLGTDATSLAEAFADGGYDTAYIGKWHVDGHGRESRIPPERQRGFAYWKGLECSHAYHHSPYFPQDAEEKLYWEGYDAFAQTEDAANYLRAHDGVNPFLLVLSWGPPHAPYETAPEAYRRLYDPDTIRLRPNVPPGAEAVARSELAGYYAHCSALDACMGTLTRTLEELGLAEETILVFTSDHGDMLHSQGERKKQRPYAESIRVPFLLRYPRRFGREGRRVPGFVDAPDLMPTLLSLCDLPIPSTVMGRDFADHLAGGPDPSGGAGRIACYHPFSQYARRIGGREYRGIVTEEYTYVRSLDGPWLLFDDANDPYQLHNRVDDPALAATRARLDERLDAILAAENDPFPTGDTLIEQWGYTVDESGGVPYTR